VGVRILFAALSFAFTIATSTQAQDSEDPCLEAMHRCRGLSYVKQPQSPKRASIRRIMLQVLQSPARPRRPATPVLRTRS
jgi:hypothetical protein